MSQQQISTPDAEVAPKLCPWCDKPLDGPLVFGLHQRCAEEYNDEQDRYEAYKAGGGIDHVKD